MRISIKLKFSIFLVFLLLLTVFILSLLVLEGIKKNQQSELEQYFSQQAATANIYFLQTLMGESQKVPETYLASKGREFAKQLELITGQTVVLFDREGVVLNSNPGLAMSEGILANNILHLRTLLLWRRQRTKRERLACPSRIWFIWIIRKSWIG